MQSYSKLRILRLFKTSKIRAFALNTSNVSSSSSSSSNANMSSTAGVSPSLLNTYGIIHDEWAETSYLGMNILMNALASSNLEICAQASAKINTILHNRSITSLEEASYFIATVEKVMYDRLCEG